MSNILLNRKISNFISLKEKQFPELKQTSIDRIIAGLANEGRKLTLY